MIINAGFGKMFCNLRRRPIVLLVLLLRCYLNDGGMLTIITRKNCVLLNKVKQIVAIEAWLLVSLSIRLHNQVLHKWQGRKGVRGSHPYITRDFHILDRSQMVSSKRIPPLVILCIGPFSKYVTWEGSRRRKQRKMK